MLQWIHQTLSDEFKRRIKNIAQQLINELKLTIEDEQKQIEMNTILNKKILYARIIWRKK